MCFMNEYDGIACRDPAYTVNMYIWFRKYSMKAVKFLLLVIAYCPICYLNYVAPLAIPGSGENPVEHGRISKDD